jgi:hypothetical protein
LTNVYRSTIDECLFFVFVMENKCVSAHHVEQMVLGFLVSLSTIIHAIIDFGEKSAKKLLLISVSTSLPLRMQER